MLERAQRKGKPSHIAGGNVNWYSHGGEQCEGSLKNWTQSYPMIRQFLSWAHILQNSNSKRNMHPSVHSHTIHNS